MFSGRVRGREMKRWIARLDAVCAWLNTGLALIAFFLAVLDVAAVGQRWTVAHPQASAATKTVVVVAERQIKKDIMNEQCAPALPPELRDMAGRD
jgi:hypothetical protein